MCLNFETSKIITFPFGTHEKLIILGVPILTSMLHVFSFSVSANTVDKQHFPLGANFTGVESFSERFHCPAKQTGSHKGSFPL